MLCGLIVQTTHRQQHLPVTCIVEHDDPSVCMSWEVYKTDTQSETFLLRGIDGPYVCLVSPFDSYSSLLLLWNSQVPKFISVTTKARHWNPSCSTLVNKLIMRSISILSSHLFSDYFSHEAFQSQICKNFLFPHALTASLILYNLTTMLVLIEQYKLWNYWMCILLHSTVTLALMGSDIFLNPLFWNTFILCSSLAHIKQVKLHCICIIFCHCILQVRIFKACSALGFVIIPSNNGEWIGKETAVACFQVLNPEFAWSDWIKPHNLKIEESRPGAYLRNLDVRNVKLGRSPQGC